jgi:shikimate kinase
MKISLIGMSNVGKTYWSKKLKEAGFNVFFCDELIEEKLGRELKKQGYSGISDVSKWMGQPFEERYKKNSSRYLEIEKMVMNEIIDVLEKSKDRDIAVDTTGSIIYIGQVILKKLKKRTKIIYLEAPSQVKEEMLRAYLDNPKPVYWGKSYKKKRNEDILNAVKRCYPLLLEYRSREYEKHADITLDYFKLREKWLGADEFIRMIKN